MSNSEQIFDLHDYIHMAFATVSALGVIAMGLLHRSVNRIDEDIKSKASIEAFDNQNEKLDTFIQDSKDFRDQITRAVSDLGNQTTQRLDRILDRMVDSGRNK